MKSSLLIFVLVLGLVFVLIETASGSRVKRDSDESEESEEPEEPEEPEDPTGANQGPIDPNNQAAVDAEIRALEEQARIEQQQQGQPPV